MHHHAQQQAMAVAGAPTASMGNSAISQLQAAAAAAQAGTLAEQAQYHQQQDEEARAYEEGAQRSLDQRAALASASGGPLGDFQASNAVDSNDANVTGKSWLLHLSPSNLAPPQWWSRVDTMPMAEHLRLYMQSPD